MRRIGISVRKVDLAGVHIPTLEEELGCLPDFELAERLYTPDIAHEPSADVEEEFGVHRINVAGAVVRYVEDPLAVRITVEGDLPPAVTRAIATDVERKLAKLENAPCRWSEV